MKGYKDGNGDRKSDTDWASKGISLPLSFRVEPKRISMRYNEMKRGKEQGGLLINESGSQESKL